MHTSHCLCLPAAYMRSHLTVQDARRSSVMRGNRRTLPSSACMMVRCSAGDSRDRKFVPWPAEQAAAGPLAQADQLLLHSSANYNSVRWPPSSAWDTRGAAAATLRPSQRLSSGAL